MFFVSLQDNFFDIKGFAKPVIEFAYAKVDL